MAARYTHNYGPFGKEVLQAAWMVAEMHEKAERIRDAAIMLSPTSTGTYVRSFVVDSGVRTDNTTRAFGRVTNTAPYASAVEFGFKNTPKYRVLGRAMTAGAP